MTSVDLEMLFEMFGKEYGPYKDIISSWLEKKRKEFYSQPPIIVENYCKVYKDERKAGEEELTIKEAVDQYLSNELEYRLRLFLIDGLNQKDDFVDILENGEKAAALKRLLE